LPPILALRYPDGEQMAKRPDFTPEKPFTAEQLSEIRRNFALLSPSSLQTAYAEAWNGANWTATADRQTPKHLLVSVQARRQLRRQSK